MSHRKTVNTLKTVNQSRKKISKKNTLNQMIKLAESNSEKIRHLVIKFKLSLLGKVKSISFDNQKRQLHSVFEKIAYMKSPERLKRTYLFQEIETNSIYHLLKTNRKAAVAGLTMILAFAVGCSSLLFYNPSATMRDSVVEGSDSDGSIVGLQRTEEEMIVKTNTHAMVTEASQLSKFSGLVKYGPLFESERMCFVLRVNSEPIAYFKTRAEGQQLLDLLLKETKKEDTEVIKIGFAEEVVINSEKISMYAFEGYSDVNQVERFVRTGTLEKKVYLVQNGDVLSTIAEKNSMTLSQLYTANPGIESKKYLQIGDEINLVVPKPMITVQSVIRVAYSNTIPYETKKITSSNLYKGETTIKTKGSSGEMKVLAEITKVNGKEVKRVILNEEIVKKPVERVLAVGTKPAPLRVGSGRFSKPVSRGYTISSTFGRRWGSYHTGIDLAMPIGSSILAADGGTVVFAGRQSSYGKLVIIDHGGNVQSYYAHNSSLKVSRGDKVFKGQKIALSGNTGRSTGPHLHFEVRINGVPKNPKNYVGF